MNNNDLFNALSGLDPKFIDEAAFELHEAPTQTSRISKASKISRIKKIVFVSLPAAAVILITMTVTLPFLMRMNTSDSASMETSDSAQYDAAEEAAADSAQYDAAEEAAADTAPVYEAEEAAGAYEEGVENAAADSAADTDHVEETAGEYESSGGIEAGAIADSGTEDTAKSAAESAPDSSTASQKIDLSLEKASFKDGILTVEIKGTLPENAEEIRYAITAADDSASEKPLAEGYLGDIITGQNPLTLDIRRLDLSEGIYSLSLGSESIDFVVKSSMANE